MNAFFLLSRLFYRSHLSSACRMRKRLFFMMAGMTFLFSGCGSMHRLNRALHPVPPITRTQNPVAYPGYVPVTMPCPRPMVVLSSAKNSLWSPEASSFLKDQRAKRVGDILTISINLHDKQSFSEKRGIQAPDSPVVKLGSAFGLKDFLQKKLDKRAIAKGEAQSAFRLDEGLLLRQNAGKSEKSETNGSQEYQQHLNASVPVTVIQILKNGNLVIQGSQQIRLGREVRSIIISGVIRPSDIDSDNSITWDKVAESRLSIGSRGYLTDAQNPTWLSEVMSQLPI